MFQEKATVWSHQALANAVLLLEVVAPQIAAAAIPGQFVHVRPEKQIDPLLRRPISINKVEPKSGHIWLLYQVRGKGTESISYLREGDILDVMGPLGNGFNLDSKKAPFLLIGGGMGSAPFSFVAAALTEKNVPWKMLMGASCDETIFLQEDFQKLGNEAILATIDGSIGCHGTCVTAAERFLEHQSFKTILSCGPLPMLKAVVALGAKYKMEVQVSLEARMACGVGACLGCTVQKAGAPGYYKVCKDGPVFAAEEVDLDA